MRTGGASNGTPTFGDGFQEHHVANFHPTVKPVALTEYLARLLLPPARPLPRRLLVPFCGSGSEILGALKAGWDEVLGIDNNADYLQIAQARIGNAERIALENQREPEIKPFRLPDSTGQEKKP